MIAIESGRFSRTRTLSVASYLALISCCIALWSLEVFIGVKQVRVRIDPHKRRSDDLQTSLRRGLRRPSPMSKPRRKKNGSTTNHRR